jgi:TonB family protein
VGLRDRLIFTVAAVACARCATGAPAAEPSTVVRIAECPELQNSACREPLAQAIQRFPIRPFPAEVARTLCARADTLTFNLFLAHDGGVAEPTAPVWVSGAYPQFTAKAFEQRDKGLVLVRCTTVADGSVGDCCRFVSIPSLDDEVLKALSTWKMKPATRQGHAVPADVVLTFRFNLRVRSDTPPCVGPRNEPCPEAGGYW